VIAGIYLAAIAATLIALAMIGATLLALSPRAERWTLILVMALHLPMCALVFYGVRMPIKQAIETVVDPKTPAYVVASTLYAPLTEEPAKLWLLLIPWFRRLLTRQSAPRLGIAIGLGFGIGELWFLAHLIAGNPRLAELPATDFGPFVNERLLVCFMHGVFTTTALRLIPVTPFRGFLGAMGLHFLGNLPIALAAIGVGGLDAASRQIALAVWVQLFFLAMAVLFVWYVMSASGFSFMELMRRMAGQARCPKCGAEFERLGRFALCNGGTVLPRWNFERCPSCGKWSWTETVPRSDGDPEAQG
jgi:hypothetical protein